jgi:pyrimidine oxygenase
VDLGVFLPISNNGWMITRGAPQFAPSFEMNKSITLRAERLGFEFAFSMVKWRGFGGEFGFWEQALESFTLMAGLASVTERIQLIGSVQPLTLHPAVAARMATTIDDISEGRFGVNVVGGANKYEYAQMGLWPGDAYFGERYDHLTEWTTIVRELWEVGRSDFTGRYYNLNDCRLQPLPTRRPPIISAGLSERGLTFAATQADASFVAGFDDSAIVEIAATVKSYAREAGRAIKCYGVYTVISAPTDGEAEARLRHFDETADLDTLRRIGLVPDGAAAAKGTVNEVQKSVVNRGSSVFSPTLVGRPATIIERLRWLDRETELDGIMFTFPDWYGDLDSFGAEVVPTLQEEGLMTAVSTS